MTLNDKFVGTGSMKKFTAESMKLFSAVNGAKVKVPAGYGGATPTLSIEGAGGTPKLTLDMRDALIFSLANVTWNLTGGAVYQEFSAEVSNGQLVITVKANAPS